MVRNGGTSFGSIRHAREQADATIDKIMEEEYGTKAKLKEVRDTLAARLGTVSSLFQLWDVDGNGQIDRTEFREAIEAMGISLPQRVSDELFDEFDTDGSGEISHPEFVRYALRDGLRRSSTRVMDFFKAADADGDGEIDKHEFRQAVLALGWDIRDPFLIDDVFDTMDADGNGCLTFRELHRHLRQGVGMDKGIGGILRPAGEISLRPVNRMALRGNLEEQFLLSLHEQNQVRQARLGGGASPTLQREPGSMSATPRQQPAGSSGAASPRGGLSPLPQAISPRTTTTQSTRAGGAAGAGGTAQRPPAAPPKLPALSPTRGRNSPSALAHMMGVPGAAEHSPRSPSPEREQAPRGGAISPEPFVVEDYIDGSHRQTIQDLHVQIARDRRNKQTQFYKTRMSFHPVTSPRWDQPLPEIDTDGTPIWTITGAPAQPLKTTAGRRAH